MIEEGEGMCGKARVEDSGMERGEGEGREQGLREEEMGKNWLQ